MWDFRRHFHLRKRAATIFTIRNSRDRVNHSPVGGRTTLEKETDARRRPSQKKRKINERSDQSTETSASAAGAGVLKRQRILLRFEALRSLRWRRSVGVSKARRRRISSRMPSLSSLVFSRLSARSTGSPFFTVTPRMRFFLGWIRFSGGFRGGGNARIPLGCQETTGDWTKFSTPREKPAAGPGRGGRSHDRTTPASRNE
jgi:hypothetical protein